jgi:hypothetical protein
MEGAKPLAITAYPFDEQDTTEMQFSQLFRELQDSGVADTVNGTGYAVSANASGMQVFVKPGFAILRGHAILSTDLETRIIDPADSVARTDRIILRLDPAQNSIILTVLRGTPGGGLPGLTQTDTGVYELSLARVSVEPTVGSVASDKVSDERTFVGSRVGAWSTTTRPVQPRAAKLGFNISTLSWEYWTGAQWSDLAPRVSWTTIDGRPTAFPPVEHNHDWSQLRNTPSSYVPSAHQHDWSSVTGKPNSFPPADHDHPAADITTGTLDVARLPVGAGSGQVAAGNHSHTWSAVTGKPTTFPPATHSHNQYLESGDTIKRANGSDRVHGNDPAGSGWYSVWVDGNHNFCKNTSSIRYKTNVRDHLIDPDTVLRLRPRIYDRRDKVIDGTQNEGRKNEIGLIAEEVHEVLPEIVIYDELGRIDALRYDLLAVAMIPLLRQQQARITELEQRLDQLGEDLSPCLAVMEAE